LSLTGVVARCRKIEVADPAHDDPAGIGHLSLGRFSGLYPKLSSALAVAGPLDIGYPGTLRTRRGQVLPRCREDIAARTIRISGPQIQAMS
jgi:hypothetical protein